MITKNQVSFFSKKFKTNEATIFREYLQVLFLSKFYKHKQSKGVFFKGGTAIHLLWDAPRFSEDLDFTVEMPEKEFAVFINAVFDEIEREEEVGFKQRKTIAGKRFLLTAKPNVLSYATFINLDFSFREKVLQPVKSAVDTEYPIIFTSFVHHLSKEEVVAEKIRAILNRKKERDLYDLWFLLSKGIKINKGLVQEKLSYYKIRGDFRELLLKRLEQFSEKDYVIDLRPFVAMGERNKLGEQFRYIQNYVTNKLGK